MAERSATGQGSAAVKADGPWTVRRLLAWMQSFLGEKGVDSPRHIAEILLSHVLSGSSSPWSLTASSIRSSSPSCVRS